MIPPGGRFSLFTLLERPAGEKHTSLFGQFIEYKEKSFVFLGLQSIKGDIHKTSYDNLTVIFSAGVLNLINVNL